MINEPELGIINAFQTVLCPAHCVESTYNRLAIDASIRLVSRTNDKLESENG
jgi:hypothetical protein